MATRNIVPRANGEGNIGTSVKNWLKGWFSSIFVSGNITDGSNNVTVAELRSNIDSPLMPEASEINTEDSGVTVQDALNSIEEDLATIDASDMEKAVYDTDNNGVVDSAEKLSDGESGGANDVTALEARTHIDSVANPHSVTKTQVGLGNVENVDTTDANNIDTDDSGVTVQEALDAIETDQHTQNTDQYLDYGGVNEIAVTEIPKALSTYIEYYVETTGNDTTGDGSVGNPFATISHALSICPKIAKNNESFIQINIGSGTFTETVSLYDFKCAVYLLGAGESNTLINGRVKLYDCNIVYLFDCEVTNSFAPIYLERSKGYFNSLKLGGGGSSIGIYADYLSYVYYCSISDSASPVFKRYKVDRGSILVHDNSSFANNDGTLTSGLVFDKLTLSEAEYDSLVAHLTNTSNPHSVTADQVTTDTSGENVQDHIDNVSNPHSVDASDVGLGNVQNVDTTDANNIDTDDSGVNVQEALDAVESDVSTLQGTAHTQNTDQYLDYGGVNEIAVTEIPKAYVGDGTINYYVETTGNDTTGDGSVGSPWATVSHTLSQIKKFADGEQTTFKINVGTGNFSSDSIDIFNFKVPIIISGNGINNTLLGKSRIHDCDYVFYEDVYTASGDYHNHEFCFFREVYC